MSAEDFSVAPLTDDSRVDREWWDNIIKRADGTVSMDHVYAELFDYHTVLNNVPLVYATITCGQLSKPNSSAQFIIETAEECAEQNVRDILSAIFDDLDGGTTVAQLREEFNLRKDNND